MFGQSNTPFGGGGGFGQASQNTAPSAFGSPAPAPLFGAAPTQPAPFGQQQQQLTTFGGGGFGGGGGGGFGAPAPAPGGGLFGAPAPAGFGSTTSTFGGTSTFGAAAPAPSAFGAAPTAFGAPAPAPGGFGFGAPAPSAFGAAPAPAGGGGLFGQPSAFGAPAPAPGGGGLFGAPAPAPGGSLFGAPAPAFGAPAPAPLFGGGGGSTFGAAAPGGTSLFGAPATQSPAPSMFGAPQQPSAFGAPQQQPSAFGAPPAGQATGQGGGTRIPYAVSSRHDGTTSINVLAITAMQPYENRSFEELRLEDYSQGNRGSASTPTASGSSGGGFFGSPTPTTTTGGLFGAPAPAPVGGGGLFGAAPAGGGLFGAPAPAPAFGSTFGGGATTSFGAPATGGGGLFGSAPAPAPFGAPAPATGGGGLFGSAPGTGGFGAPAPSTSGLFGQPAPAPASGGFGFGAPASAPFGAPAPAPFGATSTTGGSLFGTPAPAPSAFGGGGFGFGAASAPSSYGAPVSGGGLFGQPPVPAPSGFGFGAPSSGSGLFGQPAPAPGAFSFGGPPAPGPSSFFGAAPAPLGGGMFGAPSPASPHGASLFGHHAPAPATAGGGGMFFPQNAAIVPPSTNEMMAQQLRALEKATEEFKKQEVWQSNNSSIGKSANLTPTSVSEAESLLNYNSNRLSPLYSSPTSFMSPQSSAKIRPRGAGFPKTEPAKKSGTALNQPVLSRMGRGAGSTTPASAGGGGAMRLHAPPDSYFPSPTLQLVVKPNSLAKPSSLSAVQFRLDMDSPPPPRTAAAGETTTMDSPRFASETITSPPADDTQRRTTDSRQQQQQQESPSHHQTSPHGRDGASRQTAAATAENSPPTNSYYQQTIGATENGGHGLQSSSSFVPKLTKAGYETFPPLEVLAAMSDADLAAVPNFAVIRPNYGAVEWEGAVDVRGTNLDRVVVIEAKDVSVYSQEEREGRKPAVGTKLNRPATLTYFQVFPKDNPAASIADKDKFAAKLEKSARRMDADFISYDRENGDWKIRVHHFSRYALFDVDDNSQTSEGAEEVGAVDPGTGSFHATSTTGALKKNTVRFGDVATPQRPLSSSSSILRQRKATPYKQPPTSRTQFAVSENNTLDDDDDEDMTETDGDAAVALGFSEAAIMDTVRANAKAAFDDIFSMVKQHDSTQQQSRPFATTTTKKPLARTVAIEDDDDDLICDDGPGAADIEIYPPTKQNILQARQMKSITGMLAQRAGVGKAGVDTSLRMGRSFRVAASPNGFFIMSSCSRDGGGLQKLCPVFNKDTSVVEKMDELLNAHLACSYKDYIQGSKCPLFRLPQGKQETGSKASLETLYKTLIQLGSVDCGNKDAQAAFGLIACLLESAVENADPNSLTLQGSPLSAGGELSARQNTAVLRWLANVCADDVDLDIANALRRNDVPSAIFSALSGGNIDKACDVAADAGYFGLAVVLATDVEGRGDIVRLLARLDETGNVSGVPPNLLRSLNHIAGDSRFEDAPFRQGRSNLDWRRRLALRLLQEPKESLNQIIHRYEIDVKSGAAPFPSPLSSGPVALVTNKGVESIHFRIMREMTKPGSMTLPEIVSPEGFTQSLNDSSMAFHFSAALSAAGAKSTDEIEMLLVDYESQLVSKGRWEWAVFVSLCLIGNVSETTKRRKLKRAKDLLLTHFWSGDPEAGWRREFLETNLKIPSTWFSEAIAGRAVALSDYIKFELDVNPDKARATFESCSLPYLFFMSPDEIEKLMKFIEDSAAGDSESLTSAVYFFFRLKDRIDQLSEDKNQQEIDRILPDLEVIHQKVDTIIRSRQRQVEALTVDAETRCFVGFPKQRMDLSNMLSEALHHLRQLRLQLTSLRSTQKEQTQDSNMLVMMEE